MTSPADLFPFSSDSEGETLELGRQFGLLMKRGDVVALLGDLGAGKTHFVKGMALSLGIAPEDVSSPTFTIAQEYRGAKSSIPLFHLDLYRLSSEKELLQAGVEDYVGGEGICAIEWPQHAETLLPSSTHIVKIVHGEGNQRHFSYFPFAS